jgi:ankyrin repeat protein
MYIPYNTDIREIRNWNNSWIASKVMDMAFQPSSNSETILLLLDKGAEVNAQRLDGSTALVAAYFGGYRRVIELLASRGAQMYGPSGEPDMPPLVKASWDCRALEVARLLEELSSVSDRDEWRNSALMVASGLGCIDVVRLLIEKGADVNAKEPGGDTPLYSASMAGRYQVVELLLDKGAEVNSNSRDGTTALMSACQTGHTEVVNLLLDKGADMNAQSSSLSRPLMMASAAGRLEVVRLLLERGCDTEVKDASGMTALELASRRGHRSVRDLLEKYRQK